MAQTFSIAETMQTDELHRVLKAILAHAQNLPDDWTENRIFIDGEYDSNQTEFERRSNQAEIGVMAKSKTMGYLLLLYLRMIIDRHMNLAHSALFDFIRERDADGTSDSNEINLDEAINALAECETAYTDIFEWNQEIQVKLMGQTIRKTRERVDVWDFERIKSAF